MFPTSATSTPDAQGRNRANDSNNSVYNSSSNDSPFYFSRIFSRTESDSNRRQSTTNTSLRQYQQPTSSVPRSIQSFQLNTRRNPGSYAADVPPSLFNFQPPVRHHQFAQSPQTPQRIRPPSSITTPTVSLMMERALRILESKRKKRPSMDEGGEKEDEERDESGNYIDIEEAIIVPEKRQRDGEVDFREPAKRPKGQQNNSSPLMSATDSRNALSDKVRPSSSKLPEQVSRISSATLEAIAFGSEVRRKRANENVDDDHESSGLFSLPISQPPLKRRDLRDSETQTAEKGSASEERRTSRMKTSSVQTLQRRDAQALSRTKPSSVSRFIVGLEARARANALARRSTVGNLLGMSTMSSLEARHANIRRLFADLVQKAPPQVLPSTMSSPADQSLSKPSNSGIATTAATNISPLSPPSSSVFGTHTTATTIEPVTVTTKPNLPLMKSLPDLALSLAKTTPATTTVSLATMPSISGFTFSSISKPSTTSSTATKSQENVSLTTNTTAATTTTNATGFAFSFGEVGGKTFKSTDAPSSSTTAPSVASGFGFPVVSTSTDSAAPKFLGGFNFPSSKSTGNLSTLPATTTLTGKSGFIFPVGDKTTESNSSEKLIGGGFNFPSTSSKKTIPTSTSFTSAPAVSSSPGFSFTSQPSTSSSQTTPSGFNFGGISAAKTVPSTAVPIASQPTTSSSQATSGGFNFSGVGATNSAPSTSALFNFSSTKITASTTAASVALTAPIVTSVGFNFGTSLKSAGAQAFSIGGSNSVTSSGFNFSDQSGGSGGISFPGVTPSSSTSASIPSNLPPVTSKPGAFNFSMTKPSMKPSATFSGFSTNPPKTSSGLNFASFAAASATTGPSSPFSTGAPNTTFNFAKKDTNDTNPAPAKQPAFGIIPSESKTTQSVGFNFSQPKTTPSTTSGFGFATNASQPPPFNFSSGNSAAGTSPFVFPKATTAQNGGNMFAAATGFNFATNPANNATASTVPSLFAGANSSGSFNFQASTTTVAATNSPGTFGPTKSSPALFSASTEHQKREAASAVFTPKIASSPFTGVPAASAQSQQSFVFGPNTGGFNFGALATAPAPPTNGGFNFGGPATAATPANGGFNFGGAAPTPFGGNPFSAGGSTVPQAPNAAASFQRRRRLVKRK